MDNAGYVGLTRQSGLLREMTNISHNLANMSTTGYRREGLIFAEHVRDTGEGASLSMAHANGRHFDRSQGVLTQTGNALDVAIEGEGFFQVETPQGVELTRAGHFVADAFGQIVTPDGHPVLDEGGAPILVPPGGPVTIGGDGTVATDLGPIARLGLVRPADPNDLTRQEGTRFTAPGGVEAAAPETRVVQGFLEGSNVDPITEMSRMIEVQRAYEMGQGLLDREDERIRSVIRTLGR